MADLREIERLIGEAERATAAGDQIAAERALRRVLRLQEAGLGLSHPDVAHTLNDLAVVCDHLGRPDEAEFLYRRALGIARRTLEPDHPYIATSLENLSNLYRTQGKPEKLDKIREGRSPGSGLPELDVADEAGDGAVGPEELARPETPATPMSVPAVHPMYAAASHPGLLMGAQPSPSYRSCGFCSVGTPPLTFAARMRPGRACRHRAVSWARRRSTRAKGLCPVARRRP